MPYTCDSNNLLLVHSDSITQAPEAFFSFYVNQHFSLYFMKLKATLNIIFTLLVLLNILFTFLDGIGKLEVIKEYLQEEFS